MQHFQIDLIAAIAANPSFTVSRAALFPALDLIARKIVERRKFTPILSNVLIEASPSGELRLTGTDLDLQLSVTLPANVEQPGATTVSAEMLRDIIKGAAKDAQISFNADDGRVTVCSGRIRQSLRTLPRDNFPIIDQEELLTRFELPAGFVSDLAMVAPFACKDSKIRYYLKGVALDVRDIGQGLQLHAVATDGAMMARCSYDAPTPTVGKQAAIIPSKAIAAIQAAAKLAGDITPIMEISDRKARVTIGDLVVTTKLIDGNFVNWQEQRHEGELSGLFMPELDARLSPAHVDIIKKAIGAPLYWEIGEISEISTALITCPDKPHFQAMLCTTESAVYPQGYDAETQGVTVECDGSAYPVATGTRGIHLSAETVRALCGPVDTSTHIAIPKLTHHQGKVVVIDGLATSAMPDGFCVNVLPDAKAAKKLRGESDAAFRAGDFARVAEIAAKFEAIAHISEAAIVAPVSAELDSDGLSDTETCKTMLNDALADHLAASQEAPQAQDDETGPTARQKLKIASSEREIRPDKASEPVSDSIAALSQRMDRLERALIDRDEPVTPSAAIETLEPLPAYPNARELVRGQSFPTLSVQSKTERSHAHIRAIMAYLTMRKARDGAKFIARLRSDTLENANRSIAHWRAMAENNAADYLDMQKQRDDVQRTQKALQTVQADSIRWQQQDDAREKAGHAKRRRAVLSARTFHKKAKALAKGLVFMTERFQLKDDVLIAINAECERLKRVAYQQAGHIVVLGERLDKLEISKARLTLVPPFPNVIILSDQSHRIAA